MQSVAFDGIDPPKRWTLASQALDKMIEPLLANLGRLTDAPGQVT